MSQRRGRMFAVVTAVTAALANPERTIRKLWATREAAAGLAIDPAVPVTYADVADLGRFVPTDAPHQGLVIEVDPLEDMWLADLLMQGEGDRRPLPGADELGPLSAAVGARTAGSSTAAPVDRYPEDGTAAPVAQAAALQGPTPEERARLLEKGFFNQY